MKITPPYIQSLKSTDVIVVGGRISKGIGHFGNSYIIPTKGFNGTVLNMGEIDAFIESFFMYAKLRDDLHFYVTVLDGQNLEDLFLERFSNVFGDFVKREIPSNVSIPQSYYDQMNKETENISCET